MNEWMTHLSNYLVNEWILALLVLHSEAAGAHPRQRLSWLAPLLQHRGLCANRKSATLNSDLCAPQSHQRGQEEDWRPEADLWRGLWSWRLPGEWIPSALRWRWGFQTGATTSSTAAIKISETTSWTLMYRHRKQHTSRNVFQRSWAQPTSELESEGN